LCHCVLQPETAVPHYADTLLSNPTTAYPTLEVNDQNSTYKQSVEADRITVGEKLDDWKAVMAGLSASSTGDTLGTARADVKGDIIFISDFLGHLGTITGDLTPASSGLSQASIDTDRANISTASVQMSSAASAEQDAYAAWTSAAETLASETAPSKPANIKAQEAAVEAAQASVENADANIQNARVVAPISGTVTQFDAKIGQIASPGTPLISIMSSTGYEVDAGVSETDVGKVAVGDAVTMTLDAFPNETFNGSVFYIAPSETNTGGVISYQVKISFAKDDPRLKSGLTANIEIQTKQDNGVLILPQYAILQNDNGTYVETLAGNGKTATTTPVTLGIQDQDGNVEILSGVTEGEQVINIGLKTQ